jgi:hypothetical protein
MGSNPGTEAAGQTANASAELSKLLADLALPALKTVVDRSIADLGSPGSEPASVKAAYGVARSTLNQDYDTSVDQGKMLIAQQAKQSGMNYNPSAISEASQSLGYNLELGRSNALRGLNFQEAQTGMGQTNSLLSNLSSVGGNLMGGSLRMGSNALQSDQLLAQLSQQNSQQGATIGGLVGTGIGAIFSAYTGGLSIPLGAAAGSAVGGWLGGG